MDADVIAAGRAAVSSGAARSLSAWVNEALRRQAERDQHVMEEHQRCLEALAEFVAAYEAEHGEITEEEMAAADRKIRERAIVVNGADGRRSS